MLLACWLALLRVLDMGFGICDLRFWILFGGKVWHTARLICAGGKGGGGGGGGWWWVVAFRLRLNVRLHFHVFSGNVRSIRN